MVDKDIPEMTKEELRDSIGRLKDVLSDKNELEEMAKAGIEQFDANANGVLELDEFTECIKSMYKTLGTGYISNLRIAEIFKETDTNHNSLVEKEEFIPLCKKMTEKAIQAMEKALASK